MIPTITIPDGDFPTLVRPTTEPRWDTEYTSLGRAVEFFKRPLGSGFRHPLLALAALGRAEKTRSDTNSYSYPLITKGCAYHLDRVVVYPSTERVADLVAHQRDVERLRQSSVLDLQFSHTIYSSFPLRDVMPNFAFFRSMRERERIERKKPKHLRRKPSREFDPLEAPYLTYRVGVDVRIGGYPIIITENEYFTLRTASDLPPWGGDDVPVGIRANLVGINMKGIMG